MRANKDICHIVISNNEKVSMKRDNIELENASSEKLLDITIYSKLNFKEHLEGIIKKASQKVNVLSRITPYMNLTKRKLLMNSFFASQFNYCPLVWMCHNHTINNKINRLHKRCLRIVYNDNKSLMSEIFDKRNNVYDRNPSEFARPIVRSVISGTESISFLVPKIWDIVPNELNQLETANAFKRDIKKWKPLNCPCRLCRLYIKNVGFL